MKLSFTKWQGCGNDFILLDCLQSDMALDWSALAGCLCDRHYGIGADGLILILPSDKADFRMRIFNTDGSEAEMCGNGIRCFAHYVHDKKLCQKNIFQIETLAGVLQPEIIYQNGIIAAIRVDMGTPHLKANDIPVHGYGDEHVIGQPLKADNHSYLITCVSMGNPHCIIFTEKLDLFPLAAIGSIIEHHPAFPQRTNVECVEVIDRTHLRMRVWERGAAITLACGTGACASLVAAVLNGLSERRADIQLDGGTLNIEWNKNDHIYMSGPAKHIFSGYCLWNEEKGELIC